jgi:cyclomaltodextrinase / maltogenic alpha-amylase / neopullulanase
MITTEISYLAYNKPIRKITVGVFPCKGRYFRKEMTSTDGVFFHAYVDVPEGKLFYQLFCDDDFEKPLLDEPEIMSQDDPMKRIYVNQKADIFCPVVFLDNGRYYNVDHDEIEVRATTLHGFIDHMDFFSDNNEWFPLDMAFQYKNAKYWFGRIPLNKVEKNFLLRLISKDKVSFYTSDKSFIKAPSFQRAFSVHPQDVTNRLIETNWANMIGYQIFPDRFARSGATRANSKFLAWQDMPGHYTYHGGDLAGITEKLTYLKDLKIDFIYANPIFHSRNSHRYDVIDYMKVDPVLGTEDDFRNFVRKAHELGLKVVLDIPINHCSTEFFAFEDLLHAQETSRYVDWFEISRFPVKIEDHPAYSCWNGYKEYPQFNFNNREVIDYFFKVSRYWIEQFDIDGWRLDSSSEIPYDFISDFIDFSRGLKASLLVVGENWHNDLELVEHGANGITNYGLYWDVLIPFFQKNGSVVQLAFNIMDHFYHNSFDHQKHCWNFLSNHDLPRFYSVMSDQRQYFPALSMLFCLPGTPVVYYGEELCMEGGQDPANRKGMEWQKMDENAPVICWIRNLIGIRKKFAQLFIRGNLTIPYVNEERKTLVLARGVGNQKLFFVFNFLDKNISLELKEFAGVTRLNNVITGNEVDEVVEISANSCSILNTI